MSNCSVIMITAPNYTLVSHPNGTYLMFCTENALSAKGITRHTFIKVEDDGDLPPMLGTRDTSMVHISDPDWHTDINNAKTRAEYLREQAITVCRGRLSHLEALKF